MKGMDILQEIKDKIKKESEDFLKEYDQYAGNSKEKRDELGQFYTPPELTSQMLEMFDCTIEEFANKSIMDPTCGSGNLIMGALIVGSSINKKYPEKVFGNELDIGPLKLCRKRFVHYCKENGMSQYDEKFWEWHLHQGNALEKSCIEYESFTPDYRFDEISGKRAVGSKKGFSLNRRK